jgi:hypothetical protein
MQELFISQGITKENLINPNKPSLNNTNEKIIHPKNGFYVLFLNLFLIFLIILFIIIGSSPELHYSIQMDAIIYIPVIFIFYGFFKPTK